MEARGFAPWSGLDCSKSSDPPTSASHPDVSPRARPEKIPDQNGVIVAIPAIVSQSCSQRRLMIEFILDLQLDG